MGPEAQLVLDELERDFHKFQDSVISWDSYDQATFAELYTRAAALCKDDVIGGNEILANLASVIGNFEEFSRWKRNIESNGAHNIAQHLMFTHCVNHGFATQAQELLPAVSSNRAGVNLSDLLLGAYSSGAFIAAIEAIDRANVHGEVLKMTNHLDDLRSAAATTKALKLTDQEIGAMLDVAGEIIRENRLTWSSGTPAVIVLDEDHGGPAMSIDWRIGITPEEAAKLTWELTDRLVSRNLERAGFSVGFIGVKF